MQVTQATEPALQTSFSFPAFPLGEIHSHTLQIYHLHSSLAGGLSALVTTYQTQETNAGNL